MTHRSVTRRTLPKPPGEAPAHTRRTSGPSYSRLISRDSGGLRGRPCRPCSRRESSACPGAVTFERGGKDRQGGTGPSLGSFGGGGKGGGPAIPVNPGRGTVRVHC